MSSNLQELTTTGKFWLSYFAAAAAVATIVFGNPSSSSTQESSAADRKPAVSAPVNRPAPVGQSVRTLVP